jgi:hypothetical protein
VRRGDARLDRGSRLLLGRARELQVHTNGGICFAELNLLGSIVTWLGVFFAAGFVTGNIVDRRTPAKLAELAAAYETPIDKLTDVASLVREL